MIIMSDNQMHYHYTKPSLLGKLFYMGLGAGIYWLAFAGGCSSVTSFASHAMANPPEPVKQVQEAYYRMTGKNSADKSPGGSIDDCVQPAPCTPGKPR